MSKIRCGLDMLLGNPVNWLANKRVGLVTSSSAVTVDVTPAVDALHTVCSVTALFAPEHGIHAHVADGTDVPFTADARTGLPVYSLYGETKKPTPDMLHGIDILVYDIQDVGVRFYTYIWTMSYVLEAAAECGVPLIVLDRPNPIGGQVIAGPMLEPGYASFVGRYLIPLRHGLTVGELAQLFNTELGLNADLTVVQMAGWKRELWFDQTGLSWVPPSPAMPKLETAVVYPGMCLMEGTNVSEGRGTATPFECIGAPWIDGYALADALNALSLPGVRFRPVFFTPSAFKYAREICQGVFVHVIDRTSYDPLHTGLHVISTIRSMWPDAFAWRETSWEGRPPHFDLLIGNGWVREQIDRGCPVREIASRWQTTLSAFEQLRRAYFLYE